MASRRHQSLSSPHSDCIRLGLRGSLAARCGAPSECSDNAIWKKVDAQDEEQAEPEKPPVWIGECVKTRNPHGVLVKRCDTEAQIGFGEHEERHADYGSVDRADAAYDHHQQKIKHDLQAYSCVRPDIAEPESVKAAGEAGAACGDATHLDAVDQDTEAF